LPDGIATLLQLRLQALKLCLTLRTRSIVRFERGLDRPDILHVGANSFLCGVDGAQPPVDVAGQPPESVGSSPPFFASRLRWSEACTSSKASAIRKPGGCRGPPLIVVEDAADRRAIIEHHILRRLIRLDGVARGSLAWRHEQRGRLRRPLFGEDLPFDRA